MRVEVVLNPGAANLAEIRTQLAAELTALQQKGISVSQQVKEVEAGALGFHEVYQFVIDLTTAATPPLLFAKIIVDLANAVLRRRQSETAGGKKKVKESTQSKAVNITINQQSIQLPATDSQLKRFLSKLATDDRAGPEAETGARRDGTGRSVSTRTRKHK